MVTKTVATMMTTAIMIAVIFGIVFAFTTTFVPKQIHAQQQNVTTESSKNMTTMTMNNNNSSVLAASQVNATGLGTFSVAGPIAGLILPASSTDVQIMNSNVTISTGEQPSNSTAFASVLPAKTFILGGAWHLKAENGKVTFLDIRFTKVHLDASNRHVHEISNFRPSNSSLPIQLNANGTTPIIGTVDVALNHAVIWTNVKTAIVIDKLSTITIMLDPKDTSNHFLGQSIYGTINMLKDRDGKDIVSFPRP